MNLDRPRVRGRPGRGDLGAAIDELDAINVQGVGDLGHQLGRACKAVLVLLRGRRAEVADVGVGRRGDAAAPGNDDRGLSGAAEHGARRKRDEKELTHGAIPRNYPRYLAEALLGPTEYISSSR